MSANWTNVTTVGSFLGVANTNTGGWFWTGMIWLVFIIVLMTLLSFGFEVAILAAAFITLIAGLMLLYLDLISLWTVGTFVGIILSMFLYLIWSSSRE